MDNTQNFVIGKVITAPSPATSGLSVTVDNDTFFPDPATFGAYNLCLWSQSGDPTPSNCEIVRVTAKQSSGSNAVLTIIRAQENTTALAVAVDWKAYYSVTAKTFTEIASAITSLQSNKQDKLNFDSAPIAGSSNPVTSDGIADALAEKQDALSFDTSPRAGSTNPVTSAGIAGAIASVQADVDAKQDKLVFDELPTANSDNPVKSKGILTALCGKQDTLTIDTTPTALSGNPVSSGGVYTALRGKQDTLQWDTTPIPGSTNPVTSGGVHASQAAQDTAIAGKLPLYATESSAWDSVTPQTGSTKAVTSGAVAYALTLKQGVLTSGKNISLTGQNIAVADYGTCVTEASVREKVVTCIGFKLVTGSIIYVNFTYANSYNKDPISLNVNSTGAKVAYLGTLGTTSIPTNAWVAGEIVPFIYDGTNWRTTPEWTMAYKNSTKNQITQDLSANVDGSTNTFSLSSATLNGVLDMVVVGHAIMLPTTDYSVSGTTLTMVTPPPLLSDGTSPTFKVTYRKA